MARPQLREGRAALTPGYGAATPQIDRAAIVRQPATSALGRTPPGEISRESLSSDLLGDPLPPDPGRNSSPASVPEPQLRTSRKTRRLVRPVSWWMVRIRSFDGAQRGR